MLIAPFGASAALLFVVPESPLSQPVNVLGGYLLATAVALGLNAVLPGTTAAMIVAVGIAIAAMSMTRLVHPPAGAIPLVVMTLHPEPSFILMPVGIGAVGLVAMACVLHRIPPVHRYPLPPE